MKSMKIMMKLILFVIFCSFFVGQAYAQLGLSPKEEEALRLANQWADRPIKPIQTSAGKVVYVFGASMPTIIGSPMQISDIELEAGEIVNEILVGDSARWLVESGSSGNGITHIFVKPFDSGLTTSLVVTTNKRVYHMKLISRLNGHTPYVGFLYQEQALALAARESKERRFNTANIEGESIDLSGLDFNYKVLGKASWKPIQVYNNGQQTFVRLPDSAAKKEVPVLLAMKGRREQIVNYRVRNNTFEIDGLFEHLALISGVGAKQTRIDIKKEVKK
ncbi:MAG: P-type conjugative transfer protein TrbG [Candidatus Adiutrix sp.]